MYIVLASLDSSSNNKNCVDDDDFALLSEECGAHVRSRHRKHVIKSAHDVVDACLINDDDMWSDVTSEILHSDICYEQGVIETFTEAEESLIAYLSGWLARKCGICSRCQDVLSKQLGDHSYCCRPSDMFANNKGYTGSASVGLVEPCDELVTVVRNMEQLFRRIMKRISFGQMWHFLCSGLSIRIVIISFCFYDTRNMHAICQRN